MLLFLLPLMVPPITYGIPMATVMYQVHLAGTLRGVILANLVPALPFVILVMTPFIEQIDPNLESAARIFGGEHRAIFRYVLLPLLVPGMLAAGLLVLVRTIAHVRTDVLHRRADDADAGRRAVLRGVRRRRACAAIDRRDGDDLHGDTLVWVLIALQFVSPTQLVSRVKEQKQ